MGILTAFLAIKDPAKHARRVARRRVLPRPMRIAYTIIHPRSTARRAVIRKVDRAITPRRRAGDLTTAKPGLWNVIAAGTGMASLRRGRLQGLLILAGFVTSLALWIVMRNAFFFWPLLAFVAWGVFDWRVGARRR
jgi:hypothetical protein